ncbi:MAG: T9SS type A sorting domain-containing protein, partial [Candidatus Delongbacteria bacterium]|nr:T9SS type A sorting domain-containing protein [Candidatus Delongbacteria bacterium]
DHAKYWGLATRNETQSVLLRNTVQAILRGVGSWWMDHGAGTGGGWFDDPALWQVMSDLRPIDQALLDRPKRFEPEMAAIIDETSMLVMAGGTTLLGSNLIFQSRAVLGRSGAPYGQYMMEDALAGKIPAKLQIFLNAWALTPEQRTQLVKNRQSGVTRVWCYAPGYVLPDRFDIDAMTELTGFEFRKVNLSSAVVSPTPLGIGMGLKTPWGPARKVMPMFRVVASEDEILATYTNQSAAVAFRRSDQGIDVFIGTPQLNTELIRVLAKLAGVHLYADQDAAIWAAEGYVSVHAVNDSPLVLHITDSVAVTDAISGEMIGIGPQIALNLKTGDTRLLKISFSTYIIGDHSADDEVCRLDQNYPNPAGWTTVFSFHLSSGSPVRLVIYDVMGREAARPIDREYAAGSHEVRVDLTGLSNGLYLCRLQSGERVLYRKMMIIR